MPNAEKLYNFMWYILPLQQFGQFREDIFDAVKIKWPLIIHRVPYDALYLSQSMLEIGLGWGFDNISHILDIFCTIWEEDKSLFFQWLYFHYPCSAGRKQVRSGCVGSKVF